MHLDQLLAAFGIEPTSAPPVFRPVTVFMPPFDRLLYLEEDVSYRATALSPGFTVLLHPYEDRAVGLAIDGVAQPLLPAPVP